MKISAVVLTKNEEKNVSHCLESLKFCDEIIVVDDYSTDNTVNIVHKVLKIHKVYKVFKRALNGDFASQRNFGLNKVVRDWVLFVDADEVVSEELKKEIMQFRDTLRVTNFNAYYIKRRDFWWGKELKYGEISKVRNGGIIRLIKRDSGIWLGDVHEVFHTATTVGKLTGFLNHYPHPKVSDFLEDINMYSTLRAKELYNLGKKTNLLEIIFLPLGKFILNYFLYLGFLDGPAGAAYAFFMSFHSFLVRTKLYQYGHF